MKSDNIVANRYAKALILKQDTQIEEFDVIVEVFNSNPDLMKILLHPNLSLEKKNALLEEIFSLQDISSPTINFISFLLKENRITLLPEIVSRYTHLLNEQKNIVKVNVESAFALSDEIKRRLIAKIEKLIGADIRLVVNINPCILGGLILRIRDKVIDGSLIKQLLELKTEMVKNEIKTI